MNTVQENLDTWDKRHEWDQDGDEWNGMAAWCHQPYPAWKQALIEAFVRPNLTPSTRVLEIAPGHGRWTQTLVEGAHVTLVDLSPSCIEFCRERFADRDNLTYIVGDGWKLAGVDDASVDFVWSFDSFVHMQPDVVASYLAEIRRVLTPGGVAVIHHAGRRDGVLPLAKVRTLGRPGKLAYALVSQGRTRDGWRGNVSRQLVELLGSAAGLTVVDQTQSWGEQGQYDVRRFNDWITTFRKP